MTGPSHFARPAASAPVLRALTVPALAALPATAGAQDQQEELAKQLSNPVASLISVPFQSNFEFGSGPANAFRYTLNVQPVVPISLNESWNVISRTILPIVYQDELLEGLDSEFGLGDVVQSLFFSPTSVEPFIWGLGPVFLIPAATDELLGSEKWGTGPTGVALEQSGPWTVGVLANHIWSFAGDGDRADVNATFLQPFVAHTTPAAVTFTANVEATYDWEGEQWTVPLNLQVSKVVSFGGQLASIGIGPKVYLEEPEGAPEWGIRALLTLLFPKQRAAQ